jgi:integrative and conjugative element protein (TIGR02256 family)
VPRTLITAATLWFGEGVLPALRTEAVRLSPKETGGVLLGYWSADGGSAVVTLWGGPGPGARHWETGFVPDYDFQEAEIATRYAESGRRLAYLGDWHTHPTGAAELSSKDRRCLWRIAKSKQARARQPVMVVLSDSPRWTVSAWLCQRRGCLLRSYSIVPVQVRAELTEGSRGYQGDPPTHD